MAEAKINSVIKRRALEQASFPELKEAYVAKMRSNPFFPSEVEDMVSDIVDHHLTTMAREIERIELVVRRISTQDAESVPPEVSPNGRSAAPKKKARRKRTKEVPA